MFLECNYHRYMRRRGNLKRLAVAAGAVAVVISGRFTPEARFLFGYGWRAPTVPEVDG